MKQISCKQRRTDAVPLKLRTHQNILHKNECMSIPYHADQSCKRCLLIGCQRQKRICKAVYTFLSHCVIS